MHVSTKEIVATKEDKKKYPDLAEGTHILTNLVEGDGPNPICSAEAKFQARVISVQRTASGGVQVQTALFIAEPAAPGPIAVVSEADQAQAYLVSKGQSTTDAKANVAKFGATRILARKAAEADAAQKSLDGELDAMLAPPTKAEPAPANNGEEVKKPN